MSKIIDKIVEKVIKKISERPGLTLNGLIVPSENTTFSDMDRTFKDFAEYVGSLEARIRILEKEREDKKS